MSSIFGKKKLRMVPPSGGFDLSVKGLILLEAIETGVVRETADGKGYDIGPFMKFLNHISPLFPDRLKENPGEVDKIMSVLEKQCDQGADNGPEKT